MAMTELEKEVLQKIRAAKTEAEINQAVMLLPSGPDDEASEHLSPDAGDVADKAAAGV